MSTFEDSNEGQVLDEFEAVEQQIETQEEEQDLPDKYRNKTAAELAKMHQEAEKLLGRQAKEVGEIRKLADQLIQERLLESKKKQPEITEPSEPELTEVDFFADPVKAVNKAVESHPAVVQARISAVQMRQRESLNRLTSEHPDYREIVADSDFQEWVGKSRVRQSLLQQAHQNYDVDAADELFSTYKELKGKKAAIVADGAESMKEEASKALRAVSVPSGGSGESSKKIYRRVDLIDLQIRDPDRYMALQDEIMQAYAEKRVR